MRGGAVPTKHQRVAVLKDEELAQALERVEALFPGVPAARVVHDLAIRGAEAALADAARRRAALEALVAWSTGDDIDREALLTVRQTAWRSPRDW